MRTYMGWQLNMNDLPKTLQDALKRYEEKYGKPPQILMEVGPDLKEVPLPDGMNIVVRIEKVLPKNIVLITDAEGD